MSRSNDSFRCIDMAIQRDFTVCVWKHGFMVEKLRHSSFSPNVVFETLELYTSSVLSSTGGHGRALETMGDYSDQFLRTGLSLGYGTKPSPITARTLSATLVWGFFLFIYVYIHVYVYIYIFIYIYIYLFIIIIFKIVLIYTYIYIYIYIYSFVLKNIYCIRKVSKQTFKYVRILRLVNSAHVIPRGPIWFVPASEISNSATIVLARHSSCMQISIIQYKIVIRFLLAY